VGENHAADTSDRRLNCRPRVPPLTTARGLIRPLSSTVRPGLTQERRPRRWTIITGAAVNTTTNPVWNGPRSTGGKNFFPVSTAAVDSG